MKTICLYEKLEKHSRDIKDRDNLFCKFDNPVYGLENMNFGKFSINDIINETVENAISDIASKIINTTETLTSSKNVSEIAKMCEKFFQDSNFGTFEYIQKTGRSSFKVEHLSGNNGSTFLRKFFDST